jgi:dephospho-CoA kinase
VAARLLVGLTGGLASGKSTVARYLCEAGCLVVDADRLVAELYQPGEPGLEKVRELFGEGVLTSDGHLDRGRLAGLIFSDPQARSRLEEAIHPLVRQRFRELAEASSGVVVLEATLLVEAGYAPDFDRVITVEADPEVRFARAVARGLSPADARARLAAQGDGEARRAGAHVVLPNDGSKEELCRRVHELLGELRRELTAREASEAEGA